MSRPASQASGGFFPSPPRVVDAVGRQLTAAPAGGKRVVRVLDPCAGTGEPAAAPKLVHQLRRQLRSGSTERMAQCDRATIHVDLVPIPALIGESISICQHLRGKGFIEFDQINIFQRPADSFQKFWNRLCRRSK